MQKTRYVVLKVQVDCPPDTNPDDVINEADYTLTSSPNMPDCLIRDTEMLAILDQCPSEV